MALEIDELAADDGGDLIDAVAEEKAAIEDGDFCVFERTEDTVHISNAGHFFSADRATTDAHADAAGCQQYLSVNFGQVQPSFDPAQAHVETVHTGGHLGKLPLQMAKPSLETRDPRS